MFVPTQVVK